MSASLQKSDLPSSLFFLEILSIRVDVDGKIIEKDQAL